MKRLFLVLLLLLGLLVLYAKYKQTSRPSAVDQPPSPLPEVEPLPSLPGHEAPAAPPSSALLKVKELAQAQGLEVVAAREEPPGTILLTLASREQHLLNLFLTELQSSLNLQDFEAAPPKVFTDRYGHRRFEVTYRLKYALRR